MDALTLSQPGDVLRAASSSLPPVASSSSAGQATSGGSSSIQSPMQGASSSTAPTLPASSGGLVGSTGGGSSSYSPLNLVQSVPPPPPASSTSSGAVSASSSSSSSSSSSTNAVGLIYSSFNPMQSGIRMLDLTSAGQGSSTSDSAGTNVAASASTLTDASSATGAMHPIKRIKTSNLTTPYTLVTSGSSTSTSSSNANCSAISERLERRLNGILCCAVCMDLPYSSVFQCPNGHLMCSACFTHLLADARLRDETSTCPSCRCIITRDVCSRNLAVEKAVSELPGSCRFCERELPRAMLLIHESDGCEERLVTCRFSRIGCPWRGPFHELGKLISVK